MSADDHVQDMIEPVDSPGRGVYSIHPKAPSSFFLKRPLSLKPPFSKDSKERDLEEKADERDFKKAQVFKGKHLFWYKARYSLLRAVCLTHRLSG